MLIIRIRSCQVLLSLQVGACSPAAKSSLMAASSSAGSMEKPVLWQVGSTRTWGVTATMHALRTELCACTASQESRHQQAFARPPGTQWELLEDHAAGDLLVTSW